MINLLKRHKCNLSGGVIILDEIVAKAGEVEE